MLFAALRKDEPVTRPTRSFPGDAGFDLCASRPLVIEPGSVAQVPTNLAVAPDPQDQGPCWFLLVGRSSTFYRKGLIVNPGVIDSGYRGEVMALVFNPGKRSVAVQPGERLFQIIPISISDHSGTVATEAEVLPPSERGEAGFGSTGGFASPPSTPAPSPTPRTSRKPSRRSSRPPKGITRTPSPRPSRKSTKVPRR